MNQKKIWSNKEDEIIKRNVAEMGSNPKWTIVAQEINKMHFNQQPSHRRTPKQCRERWHNKLNPQILDNQWSINEVNELFIFHNVHGNKWSLIAKAMNGRTDNCVKNKFYSTLRKGMRKINKYIVNLKRRLQINKSVCIKEFKDVVLTKLIAVADRKYDDKLDIKESTRTKTQQLSIAIKHALLKVSQNADDYFGHVMDGVADSNYEIQQKLFSNIQEFCRNCKRKKGKRQNSDEQAGNQVSHQESMQNQNDSHQNIPPSPQYKISSFPVLKYQSQNIAIQLTKQVAMDHDKQSPDSDREPEILLDSRAMKSKISNMSTFDDVQPKYDPLTNQTNFIISGIRTVKCEKTDPLNNTDDFDPDGIFYEKPFGLLLQSSSKFFPDTLNQNIGEKSMTFSRALSGSNNYENPTFSNIDIGCVSSSFSSLLNRQQTPQGFQRKQEFNMLQRSQSNSKMLGFLQLQDMRRQNSQICKKN